MRLLLVLLVIAHPVLSGLSVPHAHEMRDEAPGLASRPHVHLSGHGHHHDHGHHHASRSGARSNAHGHDDQMNAGLGAGIPIHSPAPDHDHDAVYLDDGLVLATSEQASPRSFGAYWLAVPIGGVEIVAPVLRPQPRRVRPPGDGAPAIHTRLPHVLRV